MVLIFMMAVMIIAVAAIAPRIAQQVQRDREEEMIHRGAQYSRAIKRYFRKFGRYPTSIEQLENTNNLRFLRKKYADPMVADGKWRFLHPGDVQMGNQPNIGTPVAQMGGAQPTGLGGTRPSPGTNTGVGGTSTGGTSPGGLSRPSASGGANNSQIGGFIIGVASVSDKEGIHEFNDKTHYNEWYFVYDPTIDRGGLIKGPYTGKTFGNAGTPGGMNGPMAPMGQQPGGLGQQPGGFSQPGGLGQPGGMGQQPGGFGQPIGPAQQPPPNPK